MAARSQLRLCFPFVLVLCITGLTYQSVNSANQTAGAAQGASAHSERHAPPIPRISPIADPKSLKQVGVPEDATRAAVPADNPQTPEKVALGEKLFFDGRLSADGTVACSTCHDPARAFTDGREVSIGIKGRPGQRNAPTILNALYNVAQFWDGCAKTLEDQAALPIQNPSEMGQPTLEAAVKQIAAVPEYDQAFRRDGRRAGRTCPTRFSGLFFHF
jgi:cytochrome c peroxidase